MNNLQGTATSPDIQKELENFSPHLPARFPIPTLPNNLGFQHVVKELSHRLNRGDITSNTQQAHTSIPVHLETNLSEGILFTQNSNIQRIFQTATLDTNSDFALVSLADLAIEASSRALNVSNTIFSQLSDLDTNLNINHFFKRIDLIKHESGGGSILHEPLNLSVQPLLNLSARGLFGSCYLHSDIRRVFQTTDQMKSEFAKFLKTIFYQLDDKKVFSLMEEILEDPSKTDEDIYKELLSKIHTTKKKFSFLSQLWSLFVLKKGMGQQAAELMKDFSPEKFHDYMEIYDRRYVKTIRKIVGLPLDGNTIAVCNSAEVGLIDRIQAGALFSKYPYKQHVALNDSDCKDPFLHPEQTHKPIGEEVSDNSVDVIAAFGGLHHIPADRLDPFTQSLHRKLRPGGVIFIRDHNVKDKAGAAKLPKEDLRAIASVVHTFVNAAEGSSWEIESQEVREFKSCDKWTQLMQKHGFTRISDKALVLKDDPTENAMMAFVKTPANLEELKQAISYRSDCTRPKEGTRATWIEWGNVRFSKQYASFIQNHHAYAFDYIGHLRQHWQHFYQFFKESVKDKDVRLQDLLFSDNMAMNAFILLTATIQCSIGSVSSFPSALVARWKYGNEWREVCNLSALERFEAENEKEYAAFIDHTPFYMYDYMNKMKQMWKTVWDSPESFAVKIASVLGAASSSLGFIAKALVSAPIKAFYTSESNQEVDTIKVLIADPNNELDAVITRWENEKDAQFDQKNEIEVVYGTPDGHKLVSMPRYRPFTKICGYLSETSALQILEIGSQKEISVDVLMDKAQENPGIEGSQFIYSMDKLQDPEDKRYVTYQVSVAALKQFQQTVQLNNVEYIHE